MANPNRLSLWFLVIASLAANSHAAGWTQPKGNHQTILTARYYSTDEYFDNAGDTRPQSRYSKYEINPYLEYGLTDAVTLGANLFADYVKQTLPGGTRNDNYSLTDSEFFSRIRLYQDAANVLSLQPLIKLPSLYAHSGLPRTGGRQFDIELAAQGGHNFSAFGIPAFTTLTAGYRHRFESPSDQVKLDWTVGVYATDRLTILPQIAYTGRVDAPANALFTNSGSDDYNLLKLQLSAVYDITDDWAAEIGVFKHLSGDNTGSGGGVSVALWKQF